MGQRGRKSSAAEKVSHIGERQRPEPPEDLTSEQAEEWRAVVDRLPADWFKREHYAVLAAYCRHVCRARVVERALDEIAPDDDRFRVLSIAAERETRAVIACGRTLRITHQSQYDAAKAERGARRSPVSRPWEN